VYRNMGNLWKRDDICEDPDLLSIDFEAYRYSFLFKVLRFYHVTI
jgi:hypothetical protein